LSLIRSFSGIRPKVKFAKQVTTPNISYLNNFKKNNKLNFLNILYNSKIHKAKKMLKKLEQKKIIIKDTVNNFYLYKITYNKKSLFGIVGKINLNNYDDKKILGHEETFIDRIKIRKEQLLKFNTQISPIFTAYKVSNKSLLNLKKLFKSTPNYNLQTKDKCNHKLWVISNKDKKKSIENYLTKIKKIYICDGHHRIQAMLKSKKKIAPMIIAFPEKQVNILDYNRVVKTNLSVEKIKKTIFRYFSIKRSNKYKNLKKGEIEMYLNKQWYLIKLLKKSKELDVTILKKLILDKIIKNKNDVKFISGIKGKKTLETLVKSKKFDLAFKMYPTNISQVITFAEIKRFMPPKSTWFHPKPLDGLISSRIIS